MLTSKVVPNNNLQKQPHNTLTGNNFFEDVKQLMLNYQAFKYHTNYLSVRTFKQEESHYKATIIHHTIDLILQCI